MHSLWTPKNFFKAAHINGYGFRIVLRLHVYMTQAPSLPVSAHTYEMFFHLVPWVSQGYEWTGDREWWGEPMFKWAQGTKSIYSEGSMQGPKFFSLASRKRKKIDEDKEQGWGLKKQVEKSCKDSVLKRMLCTSTHFQTEASVCKNSWRQAVQPASVC